MDGINRIMRIPRVPLTALPVALLIAACGGGNFTSGNLSTLGINEFVHQADAYCSNGFQSGAAVAQPSEVTTLSSPSPQALPSIATYLTQALPIFQTLDSNLKSLGQPQMNASTWSQAIGALDAVLNDVQSAVSAAQGANLTAYQDAYTKSLNDSKTANAAFKQFGATECGGATQTTPSASPGTASPSPT